MTDRNLISRLMPGIFLFDKKELPYAETNDGNPKRAQNASFFAKNILEYTHMGVVGINPLIYNKEDSRGRFP